MLGEPAGICKGSMLVGYKTTFSRLMDCHRAGMVTILDPK